MALLYGWCASNKMQGVSVNFRDVRGWTTRHWAALYGREKTVDALIGLGVDPGLLTDPTPGFPFGRKPADLASDSGHKGIAGFLAESSLTIHLIAPLKDSNASNLAEVTGARGVEDVAEAAVVPLDYGDMQDGLSLKDSLNVVRNFALRYYPEKRISARYFMVQVLMAFVTRSLRRILP